MTSDEIRALPAGRELDALVEEYVFERIGSIDQETLPSVPPYSTNIAAAWTVVERLRERGLGIVVKAFPLGMGFSYTAHIPETRVQEADVVAPVIIARAALLATIEGENA